MIAATYILVAVVAFGFWLVQVIDLLMRDEAQFESHTHKLTWFVALFTGNLVGAIWYFLWKRRAGAARAPKAEG
jgi:heme/copper-type cytochrome/quinol oxidase subunit 2